MATVARQHARVLRKLSARAQSYTTPESRLMQTGRYRHYKGNEYLVIGVARHSETDEELVVYQPCYGNRGLWVRPKEMFLETVTSNGVTVPRFAFLSPQ